MNNKTAVAAAAYGCLTREEREAVLKHARDAIEMAKASTVATAAPASHVFHPFEFMSRLQDGHPGYVGIDGLLGVGKTTLVEHLARTETNGPQVIAVAETVQIPWLRAFYADMSGTAAPFQFQQALHCLYASAMAAMFAVIYGGGGAGAGGAADKEVKNSTLIVVDRTLLGNMTFALMHYLAGNISEDEIQLYKKTIGLGGRIAVPRTAFLLASPEVVLERVRARDRESERGLTVEYLRRLNEVMVLVGLQQRLSGSSRVRFFDWSDLEHIDVEAVRAFAHASTGLSHEAAATWPTEKELLSLPFPEILGRISVCSLRGGGGGGGGGEKVVVM